jgi:hypothetical protein
MIRFIARGNNEEGYIVSQYCYFPCYKRGIFVARGYYTPNQTEVRRVIQLYHGNEKSIIKWVGQND